jgi:hypothetical protein
MSTRALPILALVLTVIVPLGTPACVEVDVRDGEQGKNVDVRTPVGNVSVRTDEKAETGLPVYPGAQVLRDGSEPGSANVRVGSSWFGVTVAAAKYESSDGPDRILDFYRTAMKTYGPVTECKGDVDFRGDEQQPVCKEKPFAKDIQLLVGTKERQRVVSVKPRGNGSEFALVYVTTRGQG